MSDYTSDIATNIENVLLFGVAQHATSLMQGEGRGSFGVDARTVLVFCALLALGDWLGKRHCAPYAGCSQRVLLVQVVVFVFSSTLMAEIASSSQSMRYTKSDWLSVITVCNSSVLLIGFAFLPEEAPGDGTTRYRARMQTLFLFMYTENLEGQLRRIQHRSVLASCALLVYAMVHWQQRALACSRIRQYIARACNMLAVNTMLGLAVQTAFAQETKTGLLVLLLLSCDVACSMAPWFAEIRGYALWKAARHVQQLYDKQWRDAMLALALCILGMVGLHLRRRSRSATITEKSIAELAVLVGVNVFVDASTPDLSSESTGRGFMLLLLYLIAWDVLTGSVL
jgi:hypothetical protein